MTNEKNLWTTQDLADEAARRGRSISREKVRLLCISGAIESTLIARRWLISDEEAERWLREWLEQE